MHGEGRRAEVSIGNQMERFRAQVQPFVLEIQEKNPYGIDGLPEIPDNGVQEPDLPRQIIQKHRLDRWSYRIPGSYTKATRTGGIFIVALRSTATYNAKRQNTK